MKHEKIYTVVVIGLGHIGLGYDLAGKKEAVLTHAKAFMLHPGFELVAGIDSNKDRCGEFKTFSGKPAPLSLEAASVSADVFVVATPTETHLDVLKACLRVKPRLLVMEKPLSYSVEDAAAMVECCKTAGVELYVNYIRRCEPSVQHIKGLIEKNELGSLQGAHVFYSHGLFNNASHFVDLFRYWFGAPEAWDVLCRNPVSTAGPDPDIDFSLYFNKARCVFTAAKACEFSVAEIDMLFSRGRVQIKDFGRSVEVSCISEDPDFQGYLRLNDAGDKIPVHMHRYQYNVAEHLYQHLAYGVPLISSGTSALSAVRLCSDLRSIWEQQRVKS